MAVIFTLSFFNFRVALRRARDAQRRADLGAISNALHAHYEDFGFFPPATDQGKILACKGENFEEISKQLAKQDEFDMGKYISALKPCEWGEDSLSDVGDDQHPAYIKVIHRDPRDELGLSYMYFSNTKRFQIYAYLEGEVDEEGYSETIVARNLLCGTEICSFGKTFGKTPLEKSIQEYENELVEKARLEKEKAERK